MSTILITILLVLGITIALVVIALINAFGKVVASGGNLPKALAGLFREKQIDKKSEPDVLLAQKKTSHQVIRAIAGVLFGILMLYPVLYKTRINGKPFVNINPQVRFYLLCFLAGLELILLAVIWLQDRKTR